MSYTIYDEGIWERVLERYPNLKKYAIEAGVDKNPQRAREIKKRYFRALIGNGLSETEQAMARELSLAEFWEQQFLQLLVVKGSLACSAGQYEDAAGPFKMILMDFEWAFRDFIEICRKRKEDLEHMLFERAYEIFLEVIALKLEYKVPYTKLFIRRLLEMSQCRDEDALEIKTYFLKNVPEMFPELSEELLIES